MNKVRDIDFVVLDYINQHLRNDTLDKIMPVITMFGDMGIFWVAVALILSAKAKYRRCSITMLIGMIVGVLLGNFVVKNIVQRDRPCWIIEIESMLIANPEDFSFPSGHTMSSFIAATIIMHYDKRLAVPSFAMALLIAFSRLYLYVHFPTDIVGGALIGIAIAALTISATDKYIFDKQKSL